MLRRANSKNEPGWAHDATLAGEYEGNGVGDASGTGIWGHEGEVMHGARAAARLGGAHRRFRAGSLLVTVLAVST